MLLSTNHQFLGYKNSDQAIGDASTTLVEWNADVFSSWDSGTSKGLDLTNNYWVCPKSGYYWIYFMARISDGGDTAGGAVLKCTVNETLSSSSLGSATASNFGTVHAEDNSYVDSISNGSVVNVTAGDIVRLYVKQNFGGSENILGSADGFYQTKMGGFLIR